ncbi:transcription termination factor 4, mitochondrial-like [Uloborus diversus]|uniref:transcription termination factor 4, mitochondrial-like n=1 Tax=Uloborus diversus TaxID=327109 RepID=UPI0024094CEB|nr:transcription termination factor 4, mitochondrial-like [Uloborus diversus]
MSIQKVMAINVARHKRLSCALSKVMSSFNANYSVAQEKNSTQLTGDASRTVNRFEKNLTILHDFGFKAGQVNRISASSQNVLNLREKDLMTNLKGWLAFGMSDKLFTTLTSHPELITLSPSFVDKRYDELMTVFAKKDIHKLLITCPQVFLDDFSTVQEKVSYIVHSMGVEQKSIVKAEALQFDFQHIRCRHLFLFLAGHYRLMKKKFNPKNPPLNKVFSRNMDTFLKLSGLSFEEYAAFCECFDEIEAMQIYEDADDDSIDEDDADDE